VKIAEFEFVDKLADLIPPPRRHRHRYLGAELPTIDIHPL